MTNEGNFLTYCIEQYKYEKEMSGRQVMDLFSKYDVLEYIYIVHNNAALLPRECTISSGNALH